MFHVEHSHARRDPSRLGGVGVRGNCSTWNNGRQAPPAGNVPRGTMAPGGSPSMLPVAAEKMFHVEQWPPARTAPSSDNRHKFHSGIALPSRHGNVPRGTMTRREDWEALREGFRGNVPRGTMAVAPRPERNVPRGTMTSRRGNVGDRVGGQRGAQRFVDRGASRELFHVEQCQAGTPPGTFHVEQWTSARAVPGLRNCHKIFEDNTYRR